MRTINPFLPTVVQPATVPSGLTKAGGTLYLVNQSNNNYQVDFLNGNTATLLAQHARPYKLRFPLDKFLVTVQSTIIAPPLKSPQVWGEAFQAGEDTSALFTGALTNDITALGVPEAFSSSNVNNEAVPISIPTNEVFYLSGFEITMDKAATASSGLLTISNLDSSLVSSGSLYYWLVQSNQQVWIEKKFSQPLPTIPNSTGLITLDFAFPNLTSSIALQVYGWAQ